MNYHLQFSFFPLLVFLSVKLNTGTCESLLTERFVCQNNVGYCKIKIKQLQTCERFMASLAQLSTSLWRSSVKVPFLWWGADMLEGRHWEPPWLWPKPPDPLTALVLLVPVEGGERERKSEGCEEMFQQEDTMINAIWMNENAYLVLTVNWAVTWWQRQVLGLVSMSTWS